MKTVLLSILLFVILPQLFPLAAEPPDFTASYLLSYPQTIVAAAKAPSAWSAEEWKTAGGLVFITGSLYLFDEEINALVQRNRSAFSHDIAHAAKQFGDGRVMLTALGLTYAGGWVLDSPQTRETALLSVKSFLLAGGLTNSLKYLTQRRRPAAHRGKQFWNCSGFSSRRDAFPSGHTTVVWSVAPILAEQYKETTWVAPAAYTVAILTSVSRIHDEKHWASDVFAGAALSYLTSQLVLHTTPRLTVSPAADLSGLLLNWNF
jgi:membrane-associated phospholipid phosphatase